MKTDSLACRKLCCCIRLFQSHLMAQIACIIILHACFPSAVLRSCCLTETMALREKTWYETAEVTVIRVKTVNTYKI